MPFFSPSNNQRVVLIEQRSVWRQAFHEELLVFVVGAEGDVVLCEEAFRVCVNDEHGVAAGVQEHGIGGFGADAPQRQELQTADVRRQTEELGERSVVLAQQPTRKDVEIFCLLVEVSGGADKAGKMNARHLRNVSGFPRSASPPPTPPLHGVERGRVRRQTRKCTFDIRPRGVLCQNRADANLESYFLRESLWT